MERDDKRYDQADFAELMETYQQMVFSIVLQVVRKRELAEELSQDVFVKVYYALDTKHSIHPTMDQKNREIDHCLRQEIGQLSFVTSAVMEQAVRTKIAQEQERRLLRARRRRNYLLASCGGVAMVGLIVGFMTLLNYFYPSTLNFNPNVGGVSMAQSIASDFARGLHSPALLLGITAFFLLTVDTLLRSWRKRRTRT